MTSQIRSHVIGYGIKNLIAEKDSKINFFVDNVFVDSKSVVRKKFGTRKTQKKSTGKNARNFLSLLEKREQHNRLLEFGITAHTQKP